MLIPSLSLVSLPSPSHPLVREGHKRYAAEGYSVHERALAKDSIYYQSSFHGLCLGSHYEKEKMSPSSKQKTTE